MKHSRTIIVGAVFFALVLICEILLLFKIHYEMDILGVLYSPLQSIMDNCKGVKCEDVSIVPRPEKCCATLSFKANRSPRSIISRIDAISIQVFVDWGEENFNEKDDGNVALQTFTYEIPWQKGARMLFSLPSTCPFSPVLEFDNIDGSHE